MGGERDELLERVGSMRDMIKSLEAELHSSSSSLSAANSEVSHYRGKVTQLQALLDSMEKTRQTETSDRKKHVSDINEAKLNVSRLNSKIGVYSLWVICRNQEVTSSYPLGDLL